MTNIRPTRILSAREVGDHRATLLLGLGEQGLGRAPAVHVTRRSRFQLDPKLGLDVYAQIKEVDARAACKFRRLTFLQRRVVVYATIQTLGLLYP